MSKKDRTPLHNIDIPNGAILNNIIIPKQKSPQIGISYLQVTNHRFGLSNLHSSEVKSHTVYDTLERFLHEVSSLKNVDELRRLYGSHNYSRNTDKISQQVVNIMKSQYPAIDCSELYHIHCKRNGKGPFVLHGFTQGNCFEIVLLDPEHELHSM